MMRKLSDTNLYNGYELFRTNIRILMYVWINCIVSYDKLEIKIKKNNAKFIYSINNIILEVYTTDIGSLNYKISFKKERANVFYTTDTKKIEGKKYASQLISDFDVITYFIYLAATDNDFKANSLNDIIKNISETIDLEKIWN